MPAAGTSSAEELPCVSYSSPSGDFYESLSQIYKDSDDGDDFTLKLSDDEEDEHMKDGSGSHYIRSDETADVGVSSGAELRSKLLEKYIIEKEEPLKVEKGGEITSLPYKMLQEAFSVTCCSVCNSFMTLEVGKKFLMLTKQTLEITSKAINYYYYYYHKLNCYPNWKSKKLYTQRHQQGKQFSKERKIMGKKRKGSISVPLCRDLKNHDSGRPWYRGYGTAKKYF